MIKNFHISNLLDFYSSILTAKQTQAMCLYYNEDFSLSEIADNLNITKQGVRDLIRRAEFQIVTLEDKLKFYKKYLDNKTILNKCLANLKELRKGLLVPESLSKLKDIEKSLLKAIEL